MTKHEESSFSIKSIIILQGHVVKQQWNFIIAFFAVVQARQIGESINQSPAKSRASLNMGINRISENYREVPVTSKQ